MPAFDKNGVGVAAISPDNYAFLQSFIQRESGIVIEPDKHYLIEARLLPIARAEHLTSLNDLCALLRATGTSGVGAQVVDAMTTNETLFFRDVAPFDALRHHVVPELVAQKKALKRLRLWSAAASSGQEAYSLAMLLLEMGLSDWDLQILGTDLSRRVLDRARAGRYNQIEVNRGLPAPMMIKYFTRQGMEWQIRDNVRALCRFEQLDLRQSLRRLGPFDIVFCRNVLIYFDVETKKKILREIRGTMFSRGYLALGAAETTLNLDDSFQRKPIGAATLYQAP